MASPLGSGGRFAALEHSFGPNVRNPAALAASIGREKYGGHKMSEMAHHGTAAAHLPNHPQHTVNVVHHHIMHHMFGGSY